MIKLKCRTALIGKKFGRLTVLEEVGLYKSTYQIAWLCICDCGNNTVVGGDNLRRNKITSCGCYKKTCFRKNNKENFLKILYTKHITTAKKRELLSNLSFEEFKEIIKQNCFYCGSVPSNRFSPYLNRDGKLKKTPEKDKVDPDYALKMVIYYSGIDRKDNKIGYISSNVVPCCAICNRAKYRLTIEEYDQWLEQLIIFKSRGGA